MEDEVETPEFPDEVGFIFSPRKASTCTSDEEAISANEVLYPIRFRISYYVLTASLQLSASIFSWMRCFQVNFCPCYLTQELFTSFFLFRRPMHSQNFHALHSTKMDFMILEVQG